MEQYARKWMEGYSIVWTAYPRAMAIPWRMPSEMMMMMKRKLYAAFMALKKADDEVDLMGLWGVIH